jgi:hypothetical protein
MKQVIYRLKLSPKRSHEKEKTPSPSWKWGFAERMGFEPTMTF